MRAARWLLGEEVTVRGDWAVARPGLAPGGWAFEFANVNYPDVDDTAEVVLALERLARRAADRRGLDGARRRGARRGSTGMQSSDGGWGAFDADNTRALVRRAAVPRLRRGDRRAERRRDRAHDRDARRRRPRRLARRARPGCAGCSSTRRPTARGSGAGGSTTSTGRARRCPGLIAAGEDPRERADPPRRAHGSRTTRTRTAAGARMRAPTTTRAGSAAARAPRPRPPGRCWPCTPPASSSEALARGIAWLTCHPAPGRRLGRAAVHRHRLPLGLLHQLPPLQDQLPADGPRPLPARQGADRPTGSTASGEPDRSAPASWPRRRWPGPRPARGDAAGRAALRRALRRGRDGAGRRPRTSRSPAGCFRARAARAPAGGLRLRAARRRARRLAAGPPADRLAALDWLSGELDAAFAAARAPPADGRACRRRSRRAG